MRSRFPRALVLILLALACSTTQPALPTPPDTSPAPDETPASQALATAVTLAYPAALPTLDPALIPANVAAFAFDGLYDQLVRYGPDGTLLPWLATAWKSTTPVAWEFTLRQGVKFQNGEEFDAAAARWNIERLRDPATKALNAAVLSGIDRIDAPDKTTLRITTKEPDALLPKRLALVWMLPPKTFQQAGAADFGAGKAVGSGPYRVGRFAVNDRLVLESAPSWRPKGKTPTITLRFTDRHSIAAGLRANEIDAGFDLSPDLLDPLISAGFPITRGVYPGAWYLELNTVTSPPLRDQRVRRALGYAIDRAAIAKVLTGGLSTPAAQLSSPTAAGYDAGLTPVAFERGRAKRLLSEAGYGNGFSLSMIVAPEGRALAEAVVSMWRQVGVEASVTLLESATYARRLIEGPAADVLVVRSSDGPMRDAESAYMALGAPAGRPQSRVTWRNGAFAALMQQIHREPNAGTRAKLLRDLARLVRDEAPVLVVYYPALTWIANPGVRGLITGPGTAIDLATISRFR